jgi:replication-associated recombination protein RarA
MSIKNLDNILWTEKYRPNTLDGCILPKRLKTLLQEGVKTNMLFHGTAGIGKTTTAKALCNQFGHNTLYINGSTENSIDVVRNKITDFAMNQSILHYDNPIKVVIIDESDFLSANALAGMRATIEQYAANTRFIFTCNYIEKIPEPIQSRFQMIDFNFTQEEQNEIKVGQFKRIIEICGKEGMSITKEAALKLLQTYYPDFRTIINHLQRYKLEGKTSIGEKDIKDSASEYSELYDTIITTDNPVDNYKFVMKNYSNCVDEVVSALGYPFIEYILKSKPALMSKIPVISVLNAKYQQNLKTCIDPIVVLLANIFELQMEFQK